MSAITLQITGMTCGHCAQTIQKTLNALPGIKADVSYEDATAQIETTASIETDRLLAAVKAKRYGARLPSGHGHNG